MYEDNLYLSTLYEFLETPVDPADRHAAPSARVRATACASRTWRSRTRAASSRRSPTSTFHVRPGQKLALVGENGSGKTTLIKLLTRLYEPTGGRIMLDGLDLREWEPGALRRRIGVIFQDFVRYQLKVGENIGAGDVRALDDEARWRDAAEVGHGGAVHRELPEGYQTQLGKWFQDGRELSGGQWQKIALVARLHARRRPTSWCSTSRPRRWTPRPRRRSSSTFRALTQDQMAILISHRFSTVRMADQIVVLREGRVVEEGSHEELVANRGPYARLFELQAAGYR